MSNTRYYNTLSLDGNQLLAKMRKTDNQDQKVLKVLVWYKDKVLTCRRIWYLYQRCFDVDIELGSVKRSVNTLLVNGIVEYGERITYNCPIKKFSTQGHIVKLFKELRNK